MQLKKSVVVVLVMCAVPVVYVAAALRPGVYNFSSSEYGSMQEQAPPRPAQIPAAPAQAAAPATAAPSPTPAAAPAPEANVVVTPETPRAIDDAELAGIIAHESASATRRAATPVIAPRAPAMLSSFAIAPVAPIPTISPLPRAAVMADMARRMAQASQSGSTVVVMSGERDGDGHQFVISSGNTYISVSGNNESYGTDHPSEFVEFLQEKNPGDFIWFRRDGKSYVIRDAATIKRAKDFFAQVQELDKKQEDLGQQQEALGNQQEALGKQQEEVHVQIPDMTEDLHKLEAELKALGSSGSQEDLGRIQGAIGELQSKLGELQSKAGEEQGKLGEKQGALGEQQGKLGELQGELGRQQGKVFKDASHQMKVLIEDAMAHGLAKPE